MVTLAEVKADPEVKCYIEMANSHLGAMGYTDHSFRHVEKVAQKAYEIMTKPVSYTHLDVYKRQVKEEDITKHQMHSEYYEISPQGAATINLSLIHI